MKTTFIQVALFFLTAITVNAQITQTREIQPFKTLSISGSVEVHYRYSDTLSLRVQASADDIDQIQTKQIGDVLEISSQKATKTPVLITSNTLRELKTSDAAKIESINTITIDSLSINAAGASVVKLQVNTTNLHVLSSSAAEINLSGTTTHFYGDISGASSLKSYKLLANTSAINTTGASSAKVYASNSLTAIASGASIIKYKGNPKDVKAEATPPASIQKVVSDTSKSSSGKDTTTFNLKKYKVIFIGKIDDEDNDDDKEPKSKKYNDSDFKHWKGITIGVNGYLTPSGSTTLSKADDYMKLNYGRSINFQVRMFEKNIHLYKNYVNLVTGLGFEYNYYNFSKKSILNPDSSYTNAKTDTTVGINYKKNRLVSTFIDIPLLLEFNTNVNPDKAFHFAFGVVGGYKFRTESFRKYELDGYKYEVKRKDDYNLNPFKLNAHASIGYANKFTLFADYSLTPLFESGKGPNLIPFTIGLMLISF